MKFALISIILCIGFVNAQSPNIYGFITGQIDSEQDIDSLLFFLTNDTITNIQKASESGLTYFVYDLKENKKFESKEISVYLCSDKSAVYTLNRIPIGEWQVNVWEGTSSNLRGKTQTINVEPFMTNTANIVISKTLLT